MTRSREGRWGVARRKLEEARVKLPPGRRVAAWPELKGVPELTAALDALEVAGQGGSADFWSTLAEAANWIGLYEREAELRARIPSPKA
jgi:hypothetical protein